MRISVTISILLISFRIISGQPIAQIEVHAGLYERENTIAKASLKWINNINWDENDLKLYEIGDNNRIETPFQINTEDEPKILWIVMETMGSQQTRLYELVLEVNSNTKPSSGIAKNGSNYTFYNNQRTVLKYNHTLSDLPPGIDEVYARSGYIHPLYSPSGRILTSIQPPDHLHHYGVWNAWTRTVFNEKMIDFWNLGQKLGRVDHQEIISITTGEIYSGLKALHLHSALDESGIKTTILRETLEIIVWHSPNGYNVIDYISRFNCAQPEGLFLEEYRYGGFVFRGHETWSAKTVNMLTSEGKNQSDSDGERAKWCMIYESAENPAGVLLLGHPLNYNHPEPLRTWDPSANKGEANIFVNFCPIRNKSWTMEYGKTYTLRYRIITFDGKKVTITAENIWLDYAYPVETVVTVF
jgi:hypothetical protein